MRVTIASPALRAGDRVVVSSSTRVEWPAVWQGESGVDAGASVDVEVEVPDPVVDWDVVEAGHAMAGISTVRGRVTVRGVVAATSDNGVVVLDLSPGVTMVELADESRTPEVGAFIEFSPSAIALFPTGT
ncbi:hypothetical protein [Rhodococcus gannanensis]|uniref:TOBE domain-containing protein n=1 Tax=Rhodococcus gannanensis TaxID=1960308 RepID=A0ABW4P1L5_9NOCA